MILRFVGGIEDGTEIDVENPTDGWWLGDDFTLPAPETLRVHCHPANRTVYRMVSATPDECTYQIDPDLTMAYRAQRRGT